MSNVWTPLIYGIVGSFAVLVAIWGVLSQRSIARRKATMDFFTVTDRCPEVSAARDAVIKILRGGAEITYFAKDANRGSDESRHIKIFLDHYELMSIGIQCGILDFKFVKLFNKSTVLSLWDKTAPFVYALRAERKNSNLYYEFEQLSLWLRGTKVPQRNKVLGLFF
jgi:hypothetical protein